MIEPFNTPFRRNETVRPRSLFDATDEIEAYYANPLLRPDRRGDVRELLERRLDEALDNSPPTPPEAATRDTQSRHIALIAAACLVLAVLVSILAITRSAERERAMVEQTTRFYSTEARILEELRRETAEELARKNEEIARYLVTLRRLDEQRAGLERALNAAVTERRVETDRLITREIAAERERLDRLGFSEREQVARLFRFQIDVEQRYNDALERFVVEQTDQFRLQQVALLFERETAQELLATATVERDELLIAYRGLGTIAESDQGATQGESGEDSALRRFQESAVLETLLRSQIRERLEIVTAAISLGRLQEGRDAIAAARAFLETDGRIDARTSLPEAQFARRVLESFELLLDQLPHATVVAPADRIREPGLAGSLDTIGDERRSILASEQFAGAQLEARQARALALDAVADLLEQISDGEPASRASIAEWIADIEDSDPQLAGVLIGIVAALDAVAEYERRTAREAVPAVLVGTVALVRPGFISVERVAQLSVSPGDRLTLRRARVSEAELIVGTAVVERVSGGFFDARIDGETTESGGVRLLDLAYLTPDAPASQSEPSP
ncbi:MAG: hypothetical protein EA403_00840 [Spirochaetaceae bacterium]|nr:MAG: hypothetical protein EA403_00840 [Spirochaetaceae bacterium]